MHNIYLDNAATTKPLEQLNAVYEEYAADAWQNPSALYTPAVSVQRTVNETAKTLLSACGCTVHKCFFTSGGTEAANTVILRGARAKKGMNYVCCGAEHPCVEESFRFLAESGFPVTFVPTDSHGVAAPQDVIDAVDENTALVSVMHVNNETGAKNDIRAIAAGVKAKNPAVLFHSDGVQAFLRTSADMSSIDYYTVSAHKVHAHKGVGAVFYRPKTPLKPYLLGGGQENGLRSGTQNTLGIFGFAAAAEYFMQNRTGIARQLTQLQQGFLGALDGIADMRLISPAGPENACTHIVSVSFPGVAGETLLHALEAAGIYISTGSACSSKKGRTRIAKALDLPDEIANGAVRISFSIYNTMEDVQIAAEEIRKQAVLLRKYKRA